MKIIQDFKEFAFKGNVLDMAVGVIIGSAFGKIVTSVVNDLIMPIFAYLTSGMKFEDLKIVLDEKTGSAIMYGKIKACKGGAAARTGGFRSHGRGAFDGNPRYFVRQNRGVTVL